VQGAAACVTVTVCPAIVTVPVREVTAVLAAIVSVTVPVPVPLAGDGVIHAALDGAVHAHPVVVATVIWTVPPALATDGPTGDTVYVHVGAGADSVKGFEGSLRPEPLGPIATTRTS
jgi:hypothetical protein